MLTEMSSSLTKGVRATRRPQSACVVRIFKTIEISVLVEGNRYRYSSNKHLTGFLKKKLSLLEPTPELLTQIYTIETMRFETLFGDSPCMGPSLFPDNTYLIA